MSTLYNSPQLEKNIKISLSPITIKRGELVTIFADRAADAGRDAIQIELFITHSGRFVIAASTPVDVIDFDSATRIIQEASHGDS